ncbi:MAG: hypothetical protein FWC51_02645 [Proteobacteria bacterium]|nr:hypothetical protein [Pseudomonadota bacterium]
MKTYLIIAAGAAIALMAAYFAGYGIGRSGARVACTERIAASDAARNANEAAKNAAIIKTNNDRAAAVAEQKRKINDETLTTATADIRNRLRAKYTIAD